MDEAVEIPLLRGGTAIISSVDLALVSGFRWYGFRRSGTGRTGQRYQYADVVVAAKVSGKMLYLHRHIVGAPKGMVVDHINGNTLDNRRENLRICTRKQNSANTKRHSRNKSGFKGVCWCKDHQAWKAQLHTQNKSIFLGRFSTPELAALAYDVAARAQFGEFARLNFPEISA